MKDEGHLIGTWVLVPAAPNMDVGSGVEMEFRADGTLDYVILGAGKKQIMKLRYRVDGNHIVTNQPSAPREERSRFWFVEDDLVLEYGGDQSRYKRLA